MSNIFISWSGDRSKKVAEELRKWIPSVLQFAKPYFTPNDIEKGAKWGSEISKNLANTNIGIVCLTKENMDKPWILFEAGALSKDLDSSKVCSILFGMDNTDLTGPLTTFQTTEFDEVDFKKMMWTINETGGENALAKDTFDLVFKKWWPDLKSRVDGILAEESREPNSEIRTDRDILEEVLLLSRSMSRSSPNRESEEHIPSELIDALLDAIEKALRIYEVDDDKALYDPMRNFLSAAEYLVGTSSRFERSFGLRIEKLRHDFENIIPF